MFASIILLAPKKTEPRKYWLGLTIFLNLTTCFTFTKLRKLIRMIKILMKKEHLMKDSEKA